MASLAGVHESTETLSRPTTAQSKGRLVLQVEDFILANKFVVVSIHEVQSLGLASSLGTARSQSSSSSQQQQKTERPEALVTPLEKGDDVELTGFYITAVDEVENEYSLFILRQKAEYLVRMEQEAAQHTTESSQEQQTMSVEAMASSILMHLDIIGNRHRDIGKLTCREPQAHVAKKERIVPAKSSANGKQKNAHLASKRQDQRAARSLQTAVKTREAIASAAQKPIVTSPPTISLVHYDDKSDDEELTPRTYKARKSSEYRLLNRMAIADNKTIWKSELESIHDDPSFRAIMDGMNGKAFTDQGRQTLSQTGGHERIASLTTIKRAMPEKKVKHKELQERRDKGRQARLRITRGNSSSAIDAINSDPNTAIESEPARAATFEEIDDLPGNLVKWLPSLSNCNGGSSSCFDLSPSCSGSRKPSLIQEQQQQEPEQFLRKRSDASERRVLKTESIFNETLGMGIEITTERPSRRGSLLLGSSRLEDVMWLEKLQMQENARRSSLERDENGTLRRRSVNKAGSKRHSVAKESAESVLSSTAALLTPSSSAPELQRPESAPVEPERSPSPAAATAVSPIEVPPSSRTQPFALIEERVSAGAESSDLFLTTRRFLVDKVAVGTVCSPSTSPSKPHEKLDEPVNGDQHMRSALLVEPEMKTSKAVGVYALTLETSPPVETSGYPVGESVVMSPRSSRLRSEQTIEIHEEESVVKPEGERAHDQDASTADTRGECEIHNEFERSDATGDERAPCDEPTATLVSPRQACWADESGGDRSRLASPRTLPRLVIPVQDVNGASDSSLSQRGKLPTDALNAAGDRRTQSLEETKPISPSSHATSPTTDEEIRQPQEGQLSTEELPTQRMVGSDAGARTARSAATPDEQRQPSSQDEDTESYPREKIDRKNDVEMRNREDVEMDLQVKQQCATAESEIGDQAAAFFLDERQQGSTPNDESVSAQVHKIGDEADEMPQVAREEANEENLHENSSGKQRESDVDAVDESEAQQNVDFSEPKALMAEIQAAVVSAAASPTETVSGLTQQAELSPKPKQTTNEAKGKSSVTTTTSVATSSSPTCKTSLGTQSTGKDSSPRAPSKKSRSKAAAGSGTTTGSTAGSTSTDAIARGSSSRQKSTLNAQQRASNSEAKDNGVLTTASHKSVSKASTGEFEHHHSHHSHHSAVATADTTTAGHSHEASARVMKHHHESQRQRSSEGTALLQPASQYHKKYSRWLNGRLIIDKISFLQLEELVLQNPHSEKHLVKLGLRYARWSGTSLAAILLLEHASLNHENAPRTHEYWNSMGNAHLELFLRHRKFLPVAKFHLAKCLMALTRAFAYMESMADPLLLLRYAICLFWRGGDADLEKADEVFRELFAKFASFCDKDRLSLHFLHFQTLARRHMYHEAAECLATVIALHKVSASTSSPPSTPPPRTASDSGMTPPNPYDTEDYLMMLMHCQQCSGDYILASATFSTILKTRGITQEGSLSDAQYLELWHFLAHKCFAHEEYPLALEFYSIALNFAKDSQVLAAIHYRRGLCLVVLGEDAKCVAEYKRARNLNRHVTPLVALADLRVNYEDEFALLLQKPIRQVIDEVRVNLYDKAVKKLQRLFRRKHHTKNHDSGVVKSKGALTRTPSSLTDSHARNALNGAAGRRNSLVRDLSSSSSAIAAAAALHQDGADDENITESVPIESQHERFVARQRAAQDKIQQIRANARSQTQRQLLIMSSQPHNTRATPAKKVKSMPSEPFASHATSGLLNPGWERPELRRKQSMDTFNKLGYVPTTMPCVEYWDQLLSCACDLFESRAALFRCVACIRSALPQATDAIAFCVLAECAGDVSVAIEKLHDPSFEREVAYVCTVIDVTKLLHGFEGSVSNGGNSSGGGLLPSASLSPRLLSEPSSHKMFTSATPDSPVRFPAIASGSAASDATTGMINLGLQAQSSSNSGSGFGVAGATSPRTSRRVMLPPCIPHQDTSGAKGFVVSPSGGSGKQSGGSGANIAESSRLGDMVDAHFLERSKPFGTSTTTTTSPLTKVMTTLHVHSTESISVLHDFRHANAALLHSQQSFGGER